MIRASLKFKVGFYLVIALTVIPLATSRMKEISHIREHPVLHFLEKIAAKIFGKRFVLLVVFCTRHTGISVSQVDNIS